MEDITFDAVVEMLADIKDDIDFETQEGLIDGGLLDSFDVLSIVEAVDEEFDVFIPAKDVVPANFNSARALHALVARLAEED